MSAFPFHPRLMFAALALLAVTLMAWWILRAPETPDARGAGSELGVFELTDAQHRPFTRDHFTGKWTLLFFGYTHCPDVCPITLSELARVYQLLEPQPEAQQAVQIVFVSVDPARDTPDVLTTFTSYFDERIIAATGPLEQIDAITVPLRVRHARRTDEGTDYAVEHSVDVFLIAPDHRVAARFPAPHSAEDIAARVLESLST
jgi:protein SCO1/2